MADTEVLSLPAEVAFTGSGSMAEAAQTPATGAVVTFTGSGTVGQAVQVPSAAAAVTFTGAGLISQGAVSVPAVVTFSGGTPSVVCDHIVLSEAAEVTFTGECNRIRYSVPPAALVVPGGTMSLNTYVYNILGEIIGDGTNDFSSHNYKVALLDTGYSPDIDGDEYWGDVSTDEVSAVSGYVSGGGTLQNALITRNDSTNITTVSWDAYQWDIPYGYELTPIKGAVVYNDSLASKPLVAFFEFAVAMTVPQENSFLVTPVIQFNNGGS